MQDTRRDILKKMVSAMISSFAKPVVKLPKDRRFSHIYGLTGSSINIKKYTESDWQNIFSKLVSPEKVVELAQKAAIRPNRIKINDSLAREIVSYHNRSGYAFVDYVQEELLGMMPPSIERALFSNPNDPDDEDWARKMIEQFVHEPLEITTKMLQDPKYFPAGDIYYGDINASKPNLSKYKILFSAEDMVNKGMFRGDEELISTINRVIKDAIAVVKKEMSQRGKSKAKLQTKNNIDYSPADYLGGAPEGGSEQHGYKLAVDHFIDADDKNLIALYECIQR
jgi:hypothetical protein